MSNNEAAGAPVTVLGLGLMGQALAAAFLKAGHPTTVWNRTAAKADQLVSEGATRADSVEAAVAASPLVIVCVTDDAAVHEQLDPLEGALRGKTVVNLTTGTSTQARANDEWATARGITYLDGVIMAIPQDIATDNAVLLYSGPKAAFDEHEATLRVLSQPGTIYLDSDAGLSALYDMSLLNLMWGILNSFLHGAALLGTANVKAETFAPLARTMIDVVSGYVANYAPQVDEGKYPAGDATMLVHQGAMEHLAEESETHGIDTSLPLFYKKIADAAIADGNAENGYAALIEQFRKRSS